MYQNAISMFKENPFFGPSIASMTKDGTITFSSNTVLTTMTFGGSLSLFAYVIFEINLYYISLKKKTSERLLFLVFLLQLNLIGYVGDSIYLIPVFLFLMIANAVYQTSNRPNDAIVHQEFFDHFVQESNLDKR